MLVFNEKVLQTLIVRISDWMVKSASMQREVEGTGWVTSTEKESHFRGGASNYVLIRLWNNQSFTIRPYDVYEKLNIHAVHAADFMLTLNEP